MPSVVLNRRSIQLPAVISASTDEEAASAPAAASRRKTSSPTPAPHPGKPRSERALGAGPRSRAPQSPAAPLPPLTLHFPEGADAQRVPQNVVPNLHPPVLVLLFIRHRRHLEARAEPAHSARPRRA